MAATVVASPDTPIAIKISIGTINRRFKLPLRDLGPNVFPEKLRFLLAVPASQALKLERWSDSADAFITLDSSNPSVYKQLHRAAKAKLKLRIKATVGNEGDVSAVKSDEASSVTPASTSEPITTNVAALNSSTLTNTAITEAKMAELKAAASAIKATLSARTPYHAGNTSAPPARSEFIKASTLCKPPQDLLIDPPNPKFCYRGGSRSSYTVYCNSCDKAIPDAHYHCNTCDNGDYDLCQQCVNSGILCGGQGHWLIKRFLQDGNVIRSTTTSIAPKKTAASETTLSAEEPAAAPVEETRTCNSCIESFPDSNFVTCLDCVDYDLCLRCLRNSEHGHHPGHEFKPAAFKVKLSSAALALSKPGRSLHHLAICDGCNHRISGVRNKCLDCPDWDYCSACMSSASQTHSGHRFVPIYEPIRAYSVATVRHFGIYCDGPLCNGKRSQNYIVGDRYKCAVCDDTDFCSNCEAMPGNHHNKTHPLIKFKTPVKDVTVSTEGEKGNGEPMPAMGDVQSRTRSTGTETSSPASANAATQVQTVADLKPLEEELKISQGSDPKQNVSVETHPEINATFISDTLKDGTVLVQQMQFSQTWTLYNPGPTTWPPGCTVKFAGGDNMHNVDSSRPLALSELDAATTSNANEFPVPVGARFDFNVILRAPEQLGKRISYWRLTSPTGVKSNLKLWCDIAVGPFFEMSNDAKTDYSFQLTLLEEASKRRKAGCVDQKVQKDQDTTAVDKKATSEDTTDEQARDMVFPKLEKESPVSSQHEASSQHETSESKSLVSEEDELVDDLDSLHVDSDGTEDGFLTDEEYDILDASDEEFVEAQKSELN